MDARLVYDGSGDVIVPPSMGKPCEDQLNGTPLENLGELASRCCYDSLGLDEQGKRRGRPGKDLHAHILQVKNLSVYEHCNITVVIPTDNVMGGAMACLNRKGVWVETGYRTVEITANFRAILEWERCTTPVANNFGMAFQVGQILRHFACCTAPTIFGSPVLSPFQEAWRKTNASDPEIARLTDDQAWISLWMEGSRGFTHEQVRHRFAMSQRSTRYVDESESEYEVHPLLTAFCEDPENDAKIRGDMQFMFNRARDTDRLTYRWAVPLLEGWLQKKGVDKTSARKQARGASRGCLGNALRSEMVFSAPVSGWKWMLRQRKSALADAEIRCVYGPVLDALKSSRYGDRFADFETVPSPDGIGTVLK
jgi:hypothetical protein